MSEDTKIGLVNQLDPSLTNIPASKKSEEENDGVVGQTEFLEILVEQLKNQDPMDPMKNEEFAVQLAQFSQLEQLVNLNSKFDEMGGVGGSGSDTASLASYLGHEVFAKSDQISVANSNGGEVQFQLQDEAYSVKIDLLDQFGQVAESRETGPLSPGRQKVELSDLALEDGEYSVRITAIGANGDVTQLDAATSGIVSGFVPGAEPVLLVGDREVSPADILAVEMAG